MKRLAAVSGILLALLAIIAVSLRMDAPLTAVLPAAPPAQMTTDTPVETPPVLAALEIKGRAPMTGYARENFGQAWSDDVRVDGGRNGCDTRNDILRRDLIDPVIRPGTHGCLVESGLLPDPYSGEMIEFVRGNDRVHIDHVVPLADAWAKGAQSWDDDTRRDFANDPRNLQATAADLNRQKRAGDAATWQPPNKDHRCAYARQQIEVKAAYGLWITRAEYTALARELGRCR